MEKKTKDPVTGLWYHAWDEKKVQPWANPKTGQAPEFWGRSIGWVPVAILEELDYFPKDHKDRAELVRLTIDLIKAIVKFQDKESGLWYQVVNKMGQEGNWLGIILYLSVCSCYLQGCKGRISG